MYDIQHCFIYRPSDSTVSEDAGIEPRTVATTALTVRRSKHLARSHPHSARSHPCKVTHKATKGFEKNISEIQQNAIDLKVKVKLLQCACFCPRLFTIHPLKQSKLASRQSWFADLVDYNSVE
jgi:hypothetical protein